MNLHTQKLLFDFAVFLFSLAICALFSFLETSITAIRLFKIKELEKSTTKHKSFLMMLERKPQYVLITILIATNMACITTAILLQNIIETFFADLHIPQGIAFTVGIALGTIVVSLIGEIIPKSVAQAKCGMIASWLWLANGIYRILSPVTSPLVKIAEYFAQSKADEEHIISEQELQFLINYVEQKGVMDAEKVTMLQNIFRMGTTHVKEILIPNANIISVDVNSSIEAILSLFENYRYSRFPVFEHNPENIIGIIYQKDLFLNLQLNKQKFSLRDLIKPIIFVPDSLKVSELLKEFKSKTIHMAMVLDEYGSIIGLVTLEDTLEEIVGDIIDEHDPNAHFDKVVIISPGKEWLMDATIDLDRAADMLQISFKVETAVTLGGFLTEQAQRLPKKGDRIYYKKHCFMIEKANNKRVIRVYIKLTDQVEKCKIK
ncbi:HlyC/CorC family transporter [Candidatus Dependentiae bacterium]|nr:HlyC/CorC family transporter [Candidatus Dependentiae bacterium]